MAFRCTAPYLGWSSNGRGWLGGHSRVSCSQGIDCHSTRHTHYKCKSEELETKPTGTLSRPSFSTSTISITFHQHISGMCKLFRTASKAFLLSGDNLIWASWVYLSFGECPMCSEEPTTHLRLWSSSLPSHQCSSHMDPSTPLPFVLHHLPQLPVARESALSSRPGQNHPRMTHGLLLPAGPSCLSWQRLSHRRLLKEVPEDWKGLWGQTSTSGGQREEPRWLEPRGWGWCQAQELEAHKTGFIKLWGGCQLLVLGEWEKTWKMELTASGTTCHSWDAELLPGQHWQPCSLLQHPTGTVQWEGGTQAPPQLCHTPSTDWGWAVTRNSGWECSLLLPQVNSTWVPAQSVGSSAGTTDGVHPGRAGQEAGCRMGEEQHRLG